MPLIVLEGPEGAGKTTQVQLLASRIGRAGHPMVLLREPGGTILGDELRRLLLDPKSDVAATTEALMYMASRAQLIEREAKRQLSNGTVVLLDRFFLSTYAYQVAGRGLPEELVTSANRLATSDIKPDITVLLSLPVADGLARAAKRGPQDRIEQADPSFHSRVGEAFAEFATPNWQAKHPEAGPVVTVDARGTIEEVAARVFAAVTAKLPTLA